MNKKWLIIAVMFVIILLLSGYFFIFCKNTPESKRTIVNSLNSESPTIESPEQSSQEIPQEKENFAENAAREETITYDSNKNTEPKKQTSAAENNALEKNDKENSSSISNKFVSWGYSVPKKTRDIDTIVIHSSYDAIGSDPYSVSGLLDEYEQYGVSPHYLINRKGNAYRLVFEKNIAYHAGASETPDGRINVNDFSIGIELMNKEDGNFTDEQYKSLKNLIAGIKNRYKIKYILGHNQIAPGRKSDPWNFNWKMLK